MGLQLGAPRPEPWRSATASVDRLAWVSVGPLTFQFSEMAKILMIIVLASYPRLAPGQSSISLASILGPHACWSGRRCCWSCSSPTSGPSLVFWRDPRRDAVDVGSEPALASRS